MRTGKNTFSAMQDSCASRLGICTCVRACVRACARARVCVRRCPSSTQAGTRSRTCAWLAHQLDRNHVIGDSGHLVLPITYWLSCSPTYHALCHSMLVIMPRRFPSCIRMSIGMAMAVCKERFASARLALRARVCGRAGRRAGVHGRERAHARSGTDAHARRSMGGRRPNGRSFRVVRNFFGMSIHMSI